jgi:F-type H+-transporting ATPase subunit delta
MSLHQLAQRYAGAIYMLAAEKKSEENFFAELRALGEVFEKNREITAQLSSGVVDSNDAEKIFSAALEDQKISSEVRDFVLLLAKKNRLTIFLQIIKAYQARLDESNGVTRGAVKSAHVLSPKERQQLEELVGRATKKRVILSYSEDPSLIGGSIARVGGLTFDDTLLTHLGRIKEELKRSVQ